MDELNLFVSTQEKILKIARSNPNLFKEGTSEIRPDIKSQLNSLIPESVSSTELYRLGITTSLAAYPQNAENISHDLIFDYIAWRCVFLLSERPGDESRLYLKDMKTIMGYAGASLRFKSYISHQQNITEQGAAANP